ETFLGLFFNSCRPKALLLIWRNQRITLLTTNPTRPTGMASKNLRGTATLNQRDGSKVSEESKVCQEAQQEEW
ncbi:hypothetical protein Lal_00044096, partial [Lupinus albus]